MDDYPFLREVRAPLSDHQLRPLDPRCERVQFGTPLKERDFEKLSRFLRANPNIPLRIYGHYEHVPDLEFLQHFPFLKGFQADALNLKDWDGLRHLPASLESLTLGSTRQVFSLDPIARFARLKRLYIDGHSQGLTVVSGLRQLEYLELRSVAVANLSMLTPLKSLRGLAIKLGGTKNLHHLPKLTSLRYLELWRIRGLSDINPVGEAKELRYLFLQDLSTIRALPSLGKLRKLRRCDVENLKGLSDPSPIADAEALEELVLTGVPLISVESLNAFRVHPKLRAATLGLGAVRRTKEAEALVAKPRVTDTKPIAKYVWGKG